jgi:hypothetical protein
MGISKGGVISARKDTSEMQIYPKMNEKGGERASGIRRISCLVLFM